VQTDADRCCGCGVSGDAAGDEPCEVCVSVAHTKEDVDCALGACDEIGDVLDLEHGIASKERRGVEEVVRTVVELGPA